MPERTRASEADRPGFWEGVVTGAFLVNWRPAEPGEPGWRNW